MEVELLAYTPNPEFVCGKAAATSTKSDDEQKALRGALKSGHESVIEHASFTFQIRGVSRVLLAQLTRHRVASFCVQSQRYMDMSDGFEYVIPDSIQALGEEAAEKYREQMQTIRWYYEYWKTALAMGGKRKALEDARYILPGAMCTSIIMTMNARELKHFFALRCCNRAQWEIRHLADEILKQCKQVSPMLFQDAGPGCVRGRCPEGSMSCGEPRKKVEWEVNHE